ncbi:hypothetical protein LINPERHAP1_LOCUS12063 [Linum perenne]
MRLRARIDIREPLKKEKKVKRPKGDWLMAKFRYERLPNFCFICGRIGHIDRHCEIYYRLSDDKIIRHWDITLRAPPLKSSMLGGEKWLVEEEVAVDEETTAVREITNTVRGKAPLHLSGLLANLGASRTSQHLSLDEVYMLSAPNATPITLPEDRKRPRDSTTTCSDAENMDFEMLRQHSNGQTNNGIQVPSILATAGLRGGSSCPEQ